MSIEKTLIPFNTKSLSAMLLGYIIAKYALFSIPIVGILIDGFIILFMNRLGFKKIFMLIMFGNALSFIQTLHFFFLFNAYFSVFLVVLTFLIEISLMTAVTIAIWRFILNHTRIGQRLLKIAGEAQ